MRKLKVKETAHAQNQFTSVARLPATPLIFKGNISDIITQGIGPIPAENVPIYS